MATVLIVDDEQVVIHIARIALERAGHKVFAANSGEEAELLSAEIERIDVLIVNHRVPPYTGREIAESLLHAHRPRGSCTFPDTLANTWNQRAV